MPRILLVGPRRSGRTTFANEICDERGHFDIYEVFRSYNYPAGPPFYPEGFEMPNLDIARNTIVTVVTMDDIPLSDRSKFDEIYIYDPAALAPFSNFKRYCSKKD